MNDASEPLRNAKHERFARHVAAGDSAAEAYRKCYPNAKPQTAETEGPKLARDPQINLRISWFQQAVEVKAKEQAEDAVMSMAEKRIFLARVKRSTPNDACGDNPDAVLAMSKAGPYYTFPCKIAAVRTDNDMAFHGAEAKAHEAAAQSIPTIDQLVQSPVAVDALLSRLVAFPHVREAMAKALAG